MNTEINQFNLDEDGEYCDDDYAECVNTFQLEDEEEDDNDED